jgi:hypothetical protein
MIWMTRTYLVAEQFLRNQCVCVLYIRRDRRAFAEDEAAHLLVINALPTHHWEEFPDIGGRSFRTTDEKIYARLGIVDRVPFLRISYKSWVERHGLFRAPPPAQPPVEEAPEPRQPSQQPPIEEQVIGHEDFRTLNELIELLSPAAVLTPQSEWSTLVALICMTR